MTQRIVINACFGGFGLSAKAVQRMAELQGRECYFYRCALPSEEYIPINLQETEKQFMWSAFDSRDINVILKREKNWHEMTMEERQAWNALYESHQIDARPDNRADPLLVKVVEELGEQANTRFSKLRIVELPDGVDWEINEYDGNETIDEKHRSWR